MKLLFRWLTAADGRSQPKVAVVSDLWAQQFWRGKEAIGQRIGISRPGFSAESRWWAW